MTSPTPPPPDPDKPETSTSTPEKLSEPSKPEESSAEPTLAAALTNGDWQAIFSQHNAYYIYNTVTAQTCQVLKASVHDVRYSAALLWRQLSQRVRRQRSDTCGVFSAVVEEARTLLECLNIFGTAGETNYNTTGGGRHTRWKKVGDNDNDNDGRRGRIQQFFGSGSEKRTGMRMSYAGAGYPLTLLLMSSASAEDSSEPHLELPFDLEKRVLKNILKSEWLRDALSELDLSCEKLTFIGNPLPRKDPQRQKAKSRVGLKPMLRIQATGTFGSTEMDYPNDRDVLETFDCAQTISFSYRFAHISRTLRALQSSTKTLLRIDDEGLLSLQFLMPSPSPKLGKRDEGPAAFIEFRHWTMTNLPRSCVLHMGDVEKGNRKARQLAGFDFLQLP
ncbi:repair protein Rad1/Rec1/Rad17-domain-containing protein [Desarmillaria tabescens]|uniref:Repair protein Rad1/Rec1/Rad17-domain-containing protein n=1 Tax=Armillaria tabescens TaxID=1929756 RepID=A0AA39J212_ARMTA|nr:repair protein Rad1/Rec1/Rad17-domain-containing protein [Desarmillaria tabescens]KAK0434054.1 repair protein Rad1/Rec1/Rad17-domain-containing protein [Desarmillaria tabescens]